MLQIFELSQLVSNVLSRRRQTGYMASGFHLYYCPISEVFRDLEMALEIESLDACAEAVASFPVAQTPLALRTLRIS